MKNKFTLAFRVGRAALVLPLLLLTRQPAPAADIVPLAATESKFETQLIWATNDKKSPNPNHKAVEPEIRKKLDELPLKWANYFEVTRKEFNISKGGSAKVALSEKCSIEVRDVDGKKVEISLISKGEAVLKRTQPLGKGETLVLGGNAPNSTAWLVTLKRIE